MLPQVSATDVVMISITVETGDTADNLAAYAADNSFDWRFAVATPEMIAAWRDEFGANVTIPPSAPTFYIRPDGSFTRLFTGRDDPAAVLERLAQIQSGAL